MDSESPFDDNDGSCWQCGGEGYTFSCIDGCCMDADEGCDLCSRRCDICRGTGYLPSRHLPPGDTHAS